MRYPKSRKFCELCYLFNVSISRPMPFNLFLLLFSHTSDLMEIENCFAIEWNAK